MSKLVGAISAILSVSLATLAASPALAFELTFEWGNIPLCTTGQPNTVPNPVFRIANPPADAAQLQFRLVDRDVPGYNHGGGRVTYAGQAEIPSGVFNYKSPCPPNGAHTYEWQVTAFSADGQPVGQASSQRRYPQ